MYRYYEVRCKQGHCGCKKYNIITFYFKEKDIVKAHRRARYMPSVKHTNAHCVLSCREIDYETYKKYIKESAYKRKD